MLNYFICSLKDYKFDFVIKFIEFVNVFFQQLTNLKCLQKIVLVLNYSINFKPAVTYAELIIVLGVIGIISMLLIPVLNNQYELVNIVKLKKSYAVAANAYEQAIMQDGTPDMWDLVGEGDPTGLANINNAISQNLHVVKNCNTGEGCFPEDTYKNLKSVDSTNNINNDTTYTKMLLADGTSIAIKQLNSNCEDSWGNSATLQNVCGIVLMDVNGKTSPNQYGVDTFGFAFTKNGLVPLGGDMQTNAYTFDNFCNTDNNSANENGLGCTAWAIQNGNNEYPHSQELLLASNGNNGHGNCHDDDLNHSNPDDQHGTCHLDSAENVNRNNETNSGNGHNGNGNGNGNH